MELDKIALFGLVKKRLAWLAQRQEVLAKNIANADTPGYKPRDLKAFDFRRLVSREIGGVTLDVDQPGPRRRRTRTLRRFRRGEDAPPL